MGEKDKRRTDPKAIWDGHAASVESTTKAAQSQVTIEEQIAQIHKAQGLLPDQEKERIGPKTVDPGSKDMPPLSQSQQPMQQAQHPSPAALMASSLVSQAAAFGVRPMTATMVPVVQMAPTSVVLVQQPTLGKTEIENTIF